MPEYGTINCRSLRRLQKEARLTNKELEIKVQDEIKIQLAQSTISRIRRKIGAPHKIETLYTIAKIIADRLNKEPKEIRKHLKIKTSIRKSSNNTLTSVFKEHSRKVLIDHKIEQEQLNYWIDLNLVKVDLKEQIRNEPVNAIEQLRECIISGKNAIIFGESGSGKSLMFYKKWNELRKKYLNAETRGQEKIPIYIKLSSIERKSIDNFEQLLEKTIEIDLTKEDKSKYVLFIDGLNESGNSDTQDNIYAEIDEFASYYREFTIFLCTQNVYNLSILSENFHLYELQTFDKDSSVDYLEKYSNKFDTRKDAEKFYSDLPNLIREFTSVPVFLRILAQIYEKKQEMHISNPGQLFKKFEIFLCESRPLGRKALDKDYRNHAIPFIAYNMCDIEIVVLPRKKFNKFVRIYNEHESDSINNKELKDTILNNYKIMFSDSSGNTQFIYENLKGFFASKQIKNDSEEPDWHISSLKKLIYPNKNTKNASLANALKFFVGIVSPEVATSTIIHFIKQDVYFACELYVWSSIRKFDKYFVDLIEERIDLDSNEYFFNLGKTTNFYSKVLDLVKKSHISNELEYADYLGSLGCVYSTRYEFDKSIQCYSEVGKIYNKYNKQHTNSAIMSMNLGVDYIHIFQNDKAIECLMKAVSLFEFNDLQKDTLYALCHINLGTAFSNKSLDYKALKYYMKAIKLYEENDFLEHIDLGLCYTNIGNIYQRGLNYESALEFYNKSISLYEKKKLTANPQYAECLSNRGFMFLSIFEYQKAYKSQKVALEIFKKNDMTENPSFALCNYSIGMVFIEFSNYDKAIEHLNEGIAVFVNNNILEHQYYPICLTGLGIAYSEKLEFDKAIKYFDKAISINENNNRQDYPIQANLYLNLGSALINKNEHDHALKYLRNALNIYENNEMQTRPEYAKCLMGMANSYKCKSDYENAIEYSKRAIWLFVLNKMSTHPVYAICHMNLGVVYCNMKMHENAIVHYVKAISIFEFNKLKHNSTHIEYAFCLKNLGNVYSERFEYENAIAHYKKAISIFEKINMKSHTECAKCYLNIGTLYYGLGAKTIALRTLESAINIIILSLGINSLEHTACLSLIEKIKNELSD